MGNKIRRPLSVWIAQILLALLAGFVLVMCLLPLAYLYALPSLDIRVPILMILLLFVFLSGIAFLGMALRAPYGRWLGVGILSVVLIFSTLIRFFGPFDIFQDQELVDISTQIFLSAIMIAVILHISFSKKAAAFFLQGRPPLP